MIFEQQKAIMSKDLKGLLDNKKNFSVLLVIPILFGVILPISLCLAVLLSPEDASFFDEIAQFLPEADSLNHNHLVNELLTFFLNSVIPIFFLIIPIMSASVIAASSFVGEKEKRTLETLFYSPLTLKEIFQAKVYVSFCMGCLLSYISFVISMTLIIVGIYVLEGLVLTISISWLWILLLIVPSITLIAIVLIVKGSAKSSTIEESQQKSAFLILPLMLILVGQFTGILVLGSTVLFVAGMILLVVSLLMLKHATKKIDYEKMLD